MILVDCTLSDLRVFGITIVRPPVTSGSGKPGGTGVQGTGEGTELILNLDREK